MWNLLNQEIILRDEDPELYQDLKNKIKNRTYVLILQKLGWEVKISNDKIILKKSMNDVSHLTGVSDFKDQLDYVIYAATIYYLNTTSVDHIFTAEEFIDHLKMILEKTEITIDENILSTKYSIYRALKYCEKTKLIRKLDGDAIYLVEHLSSIEGVLYQNNGVTREIKVNHQKETIENKVYRKLTVTPMLYFSDKNPEEKKYILQHQEEIEDNIRLLFDTDINFIVQDNFAAIFVVNSNSAKKIYMNDFPKNNMKDQFLVRVITFLQKYVTKEKKNLISMMAFINIIEDVRREDYEYWTKEYQTLSINQLTQIALKNLIHLKAITSYGEEYIKAGALSSMIEGELI